MQGGVVLRHSQTALIYVSWTVSLFSPLHVLLGANHVESLEQDLCLCMHVFLQAEHLGA